MITEGDKVPSFVLDDANGKIIKSSDFKGKKHVIYFYPRDFTPGCTIEADEFFLSPNTEFLCNIS